MFHLSTRINQLEVQDPSQVCFVAWSDAALANRIDLGSKLVECGCCHLLPKSLMDIVRRCLLCHGDEANWREKLDRLCQLKRGHFLRLTKN